MAGCFGNHPFDRAREAELNRYLNTLDEDDYMDAYIKLDDARAEGIFTDEEFKKKIEELNEEYGK